MLKNYLVGTGPDLINHSACPSVSNAPITTLSLRSALRKRTPGAGRLCASANHSEPDFPREDSNRGKMPRLPARLPSRHRWRKRVRVSLTFPTSSLRNADETSDRRTSASASPSSRLAFAKSAAQPDSENLAPKFWINLPSTAAVTFRPNAPAIGYR
jgi:hypothetical protein